MLTWAPTLFKVFNVIVRLKKVNCFLGPPSSVLNAPHQVAHETNVTVMFSCPHLSFLACCQGSKPVLESFSDIHVYF